MEGTPKLPRKSLSLTRLGTKRRNTSPQHKQRLEFQIVTDTSRSPNFERGMRSPSVVSLSSDAGCDCTPPHKKINLDDSLDYSPRAMDTSCSPSQFLSQSFSIDSPEVGWRWGQRRKNAGSGDDERTKTPDSAYAADSSFTSASPSDFRTRTRSDTWRYRQSYDTQRENQRKALEAEIRKAKKERTDELLKKRCAKLEEQLKGEGKEKKVEPDISSPAAETVDGSMNPSTSKAVELNGVTLNKQLPKSKSSLDAADAALKYSDAANDYFDDSDCDDLLLMATQQLETQILEATQQSKASQLNKVATNQSKAAFKLAMQPAKAPAPPVNAATLQTKPSVQVATHPVKPPVRVVTEHAKPPQQTKPPLKVATNQAKAPAKAATHQFRVVTEQAKPLVQSSNHQAKLPQQSKLSLKVAPPIKTATPTAMQQKLRSSLYMQFLEDDLSDDIFRNLDDGTQSKPRNSFQRYNSMPVQTATGSKVGAKPVEAPGKKDPPIKQASSDEILMAGGNSKFKRHVSSNALSPSSTSSRGRQLLLKK